MITETEKKLIKDNAIIFYVRHYDILNYLASNNDAYATANRLAFFNDKIEQVKNKVFIDSIGVAYNGYKLLQDARQLNINEMKRKRRCRYRTLQLMQTYKNVYFMTLTYKPSVYDATNIDTKRRYAYRFLKDNQYIYIANQDYGKTKGRYHIHVLLATNEKLDYMTFTKLWGYGGTYAEQIKNNANDKQECMHYEIADIRKVSDYVSKLTNHALKETTQNTRLMYKRKDANLCFEWNYKK